MEFAGHEEDAKQLRISLVAQRAEGGNLQSALSSAERTILQHSKALDASQALVARLQTQLAVAERQKADMIQQLELGQQDHQALTLALKTMQQELSDAARDLDRTKEEGRASAEHLSEVSTTLLDMTKRSQVQQSQLEEGAEACMKLVQERNDVSEQLRALTKRHQQAQQELVQAQAGIASLQARLQAQTSITQQQQTVIDAADKKTHALQQQLGSLEDQMHDLEEQRANADQQAELAQDNLLRSETQAHQSSLAAENAADLQAAEIAALQATLERSKQQLQSALATSQDDARAWQLSQDTKHQQWSELQASLEQKATLLAETLASERAKQLAAKDTIHALEQDHAAAAAKHEQEIRTLWDRQCVSEQQMAQLGDLLEAEKARHSVTIDDFNATKHEHARVAAEQAEQVHALSSDRNALLGKCEALTNALAAETAQQLKAQDTPSVTELDHAQLTSELEQQIEKLTKAHDASMLQKAELSEAAAAENLQRTAAEEKLLTMQQKHAHVMSDLEQQCSSANALHQEEIRHLSGNMATLQSQLDGTNAELESARAAQRLEQQAFAEAAAELADLQKKLQAALDQVLELESTLSRAHENEAALRLAMTEAQASHQQLCEGLNAEIKQGQIQSDAHLLYCTAAAAKHEDTCAQLAASQSLSDSLQDQQKKLHEQYSTSQQLVSTLQAQLAATEGQRNAVHNQLDDMQKQLGTSSIEAAQALQILQLQLAERMSNAEALENEHVKLEGQMAEESTKLRDAEKFLTAQQAENLEAVVEQTRLQQSFDALECQLTGAKGDNAKLQAQFDDLQERCQALQDQLEQSTSTAISERHERDGLERQMAEETIKLNDTEELLKARHAEISEAAVELIRLQQSLDELQEEHQTLQDRAAAYQQTMQEMQRQMVLLDAGRADAQEQCASLQAQLAQAETNQLQAQQQASNLQWQLEDATQQASQAQIQLQQEWKIVRETHKNERAGSKVQIAGLEATVDKLQASSTDRAHAAEMLCQDLEKHVMLAQQAAASLQEQLSVSEEQMQKATAEKDDVNLQLLTAQQARDDLQEQLDHATQQASQAQLQLQEELELQDKSHKTEQGSMDAKFTDLEATMERLQGSEIAKAQAAEALCHDLNEQVSLAQQEAASLQEKLSASGEALQTVIADKEDANVQLQAAQQAMNSLQEQLFMCNGQLQAADVQLEDARSQIQDIQQALGNEQDEGSRIRTELVRSQDESTAAASAHHEVILQHQRQAAEQEQKQAVLTQQLLDLHAQLQRRLNDLAASDDIVMSLRSACSTHQHASAEKEQQLAAAMLHSNGLQEQLLELQNAHANALQLQEESEWQLSQSQRESKIAMEAQHAGEQQLHEAQVALKVAQEQLEAHGDQQDLSKAADMQVLTASLQASRWHQQDLSEQLSARESLLAAREAKTAALRQDLTAATQACCLAEQAHASLRDFVEALQTQLAEASSILCKENASVSDEDQLDHHEQQSLDVMQSEPVNAEAASSSNKHDSPPNTSLMSFMVDLSCTAQMQQDLLQQLLEAEVRTAADAQHQASGLKQQLQALQQVRQKLHDQLSTTQHELQQREARNELLTKQLAVLCSSYDATVQDLTAQNDLLTKQHAVLCSDHGPSSASPHELKALETTHSEALTALQEAHLQLAHARASLTASLQEKQAAQSTLHMREQLLDFILRLQEAQQTQSELLMIQLSESHSREAQQQLAQARASLMASQQEQQAAQSTSHMHGQLLDFLLRLQAAQQNQSQLLLLQLLESQPEQQSGTLKLDRLASTDAVLQLEGQLAENAHRMEQLEQALKHEHVRHQHLRVGLHVLES